MSLLVEIGIFILGFVALGSLVLFIFSFAKPLTKTSNPEFPYTQSATYEYNAPAPSGVYDSSALASGDPVFTNLTCQINLLVKYKIQGEGLTGLTGSHYLTAAISDPVSGWKRTFPLESQQYFDGDNFSSLVMVDFCQIRAAIKDMETQTGATSFTYALSIEPNVIQMGSIQDTQLLTSFNIALPFLMDNNRVFIAKLDDPSDPLNPVTEKVLSSETVVQNTLHLFSAELSIKAVRFISIIGLLLSMTGVWFLFTNISKASKRDKGVMVKLKYGGSLVDVADSPIQNERAVISVKEIDDLAKLAEKMDTVILHHADTDKHYYFVEVNGLTYQCILDQEFKDLTPPPLNQVIETDISRALREHEFEVYFQPVISLQDRKLESVEALIRWNNSRRGVLHAGDFLAEVETSGEILELGKSFRDMAVKQFLELKRIGISTRLALNLSPIELSQLSEDSLVSPFIQSGVKPADVLLEFSHHVAQNADTCTKLTALQAMGFQLVVQNSEEEIDPTILDLLPITLLKLDRYIIANLDQPFTASKTRNLIHYCAIRGIKVVANGVENRSEINLARSLLFSQAQGNAIAAPSPANELTPLLLKFNEQSLRSG